MPLRAEFTTRKAIMERLLRTPRSTGFSSYRGEAARVQREKTGNHVETPTFSQVSTTLEARGT
jgi:hypothetical protein